MTPLTRLVREVLDAAEHRDIDGVARFVFAPGHWAKLNDAATQAAPAPAPAGTPTDEELRDVYWNATDDGTGRISAERLAEIREQHAMDYAEYTRRAERQSWRDEVRPHPMDSGYFIDAHHARGALLAEVDRLRDALTAAEALAYLGDHHFPSLTHKARLEELVPKHRELGRALAAAEAERLLLARHVLNRSYDADLGRAHYPGDQDEVDIAIRVCADDARARAGRGGAEGGGDGLGAEEENNGS